MGAEQKFSNGLVDRRSLLRMLALGGAGFALSSCNGLLVPQREGLEKLVQTPKAGDLLMDKKSQIYLLGPNGRKYLVPDRDQYLFYIKQEGKIVLSGTREVEDALDRYPTAAVPQEKLIVVLGDIKTNKPKGGELIGYGTGFMTEDGIPNDGLVRPKGAFLRFKSRMQSLDFTERDNVLDPWGREREYREYFNTYSAADTGQGLETSVDNLIDYLLWLYGEFPLCKQNWIVHSLDGVVFVRALIKKPELLSIINNLILLSSPVRGLDPFHKALFDLARSQYPILDVYLNNEKVSTDLANLWNSAAHQKAVDELGKTMVALHIGLISAGARDDLIVSNEARKIEGAEDITIEGGFNIRNLLTYIPAHGVTIKSDLVIERTMKKIGQNRAA